MSSGTTNVRPAKAAQAWQARSNDADARGLTPKVRSRCFLDASARLAMYCMMFGADTTVSAVSCISRTWLRVSTAPSEGNPCSVRRRISTSSSGVGRPMVIDNMNLSSRELGNGKVPWVSTRFWVAMMTKGRGRGQTVPSALTTPSAIASSSADWVRGPVRFNSSATTTLAKIGPGIN